MSAERTLAGMYVASCSWNTGIAELQAKVGQEVDLESGATPWFSLIQRDADLFSALTDDGDYMHNDAKSAKPRSAGTISCYGLGVKDKWRS